MAPDLSSSLFWLEINNVNKPTSKGTSAVEDLDVNRIIVPNTIRSNPMYLVRLLSAFIIQRLV